MVPCFCQPLACLFGSAVGGKRIKNATLPRRRQGRAPHNGNALNAVAYFARVNIDISSRYGAKPPQWGKPLACHTTAAHNPHVRVEGVVLL